MISNVSYFRADIREEIQRRREVPKAVLLRAGKEPAEGKAPDR